MPSPLSSELPGLVQPLVVHPRGTTLRTGVVPPPAFGRLPKQAMRRPERLWSLGVPFTVSSATTVIEGVFSPEFQQPYRVDGISIVSSEPMDGAIRVILAVTQGDTAIAAAAGNYTPIHPEIQSDGTLAHRYFPDSDPIWLPIGYMNWRWPSRLLFILDNQSAPTVRMSGLWQVTFFDPCPCDPPDAGYPAP